MKLFKSKKMLSMMAVLMMLSFAVSMFAVPNATAQSDKATFPFVDAIPHKAGTGQSVLINWGLLNQLFVDGDGWNVTLQITYPNGKTENTTAKTWSTGNLGRRFTFTEEGNYTLRCVFDRAYYNSTSASFRGWYAESISENVTLQIVEGYTKPNYPGHSHPTEYWTRPVDQQLREWYSLMGSWLIGASATTYGSTYTQAKFNDDAPESAHVLWSMPIGDTMGGVAGVEDAVGFQNGDAYEGKFAGAVVVAGVLYYNRDGTYNSASNITGALGDNTVANPGKQRNTIVAVDLHTGKTLWERSYNFGANNDARITRGQILTWICLNNRGTWAYLWLTNGTTMYAVEPKTGDLVYNMTNVPAGTIYIGPNGEMLKYQTVNIGTTTNPVYQLRQWNSSYVVAQGKTGMAESWGSQVQGVTYDANVRGWDLNLTLSGLTALPGSIVMAYPEDRVIFANASTAGIEMTGISLDSENSGQVMFNRKTWKAPLEWDSISPTGSQNGWVSFSEEEKVAIYWTKYNRVNYAFSLDTGNYLWQTEPQIYADGWTDSPSYEKVIAYGKLYEASVGGILYCYDIKTGDLLWTYEATDKHNESYHGENWWLIITMITDGKIYMGHMVHSAQMPISRGAPFICIDAETHEVIWEIDGAFRQTRWGGRAIMGDSIIATMDVYDQQVYAIGKGPSEVTVSAPTVAVTAGTKALITGTVMDVSPGTEQDGLRYRFANGVPAMSDESQSEWMLHVYKNFEEPMGAKGIEVTVYAWDVENNNRINIGTTTSNARGQYSIAWTPDKEGMYDIWVYFEGTAAFYGDDAQTTMAVSAAPEVPPPVENPPYEWYIIGAAIIVIVVNLVVALLLRKK